jgi:hypothetical protein
MMSATTAEAVGSAPPRPVEQALADRVALDQHRVHHPVDVGQQMPLRNQGRMHPQLHAVFIAAGDAQMLDPIAELSA